MGSGGAFGAFGPGCGATLGWAKPSWTGPRPRISGASLSLGTAGGGPGLSLRSKGGTSGSAEIDGNRANVPTRRARIPRRRVMLSFMACPPYLSDVIPHSLFYAGDHGSNDQFLITCARVRGGSGRAGRNWS